MEGVILYVFLHDPCGGCGTDSPGCGDCQLTFRYHGMLKQQLDERLYDGSIAYRMLNCRMLANTALYKDFFGAYGVPETEAGHLPTVFIGEAEHGLYLVGEESLSLVGEAMDRYMAGEDVPSILADLGARDE